MTIPNGRGLGHNKKILTKRQARRIARYQAGLIIEAILSNGYDPEDLHDRYGEEGLAEIISGLESYACWLIDTGDPDGKATS